MDIEQLMTAAREVSGHAHAPYSVFPVGTAVLASDSRVFVGCNIENASHSLTICAERAAVSAAVAGGAKKLVAAAIYTPTDKPVTPCGACRQVLAEFADDMAIVVACEVGEPVEYRLTELLPHAFRF